MAKKKKNPCHRCDGLGTKELHPCPFNADVFNDDSDVCNCCEDCAQECADDI